MAHFMNRNELHSEELEKVAHRREGYVYHMNKGYRWVEYNEVDGLGIIEGDIVVGNVREIEEVTRRIEEALIGEQDTYKVIRQLSEGMSRLWTDGVVPYTVDPKLGIKEKIEVAMAHWQEHTPILFEPRKGQVDYVTFKAAEGCSSNVGRCGGQQYIYLSESCTVGNIIHEIGHAIGLRHQENRFDRDEYIMILSENIREDKLHNFTKHEIDGEDIGRYDYKSIMHSGRMAFSNGGKPTILPINRKVHIGQREQLSSGDKKAANLLYKFTNVDPITQLTIITGDTPDIQPPKGFVKIEQNLNEHNRGRYLFLCYKKGKGEPITDIVVLSKKTSSLHPPKGYIRLEKNINDDTGGVPIYICYSKDKGVPITNLDVITGFSSGVYPQNDSFVRIHQDLNDGAAGNFLYLCYQPDPMAPITEVAFAVGLSKEAKPPKKDMIRLNVDLNKGTGGKYIYPCYKRGYETPITDIDIVRGVEPDLQAPQGFEKTDQGVVEVTDDRYMTLCYKSGEGKPLIDMSVMSGTRDRLLTSKRHIRISNENQGTVPYMYLCFNTKA